MMVRSLLKLASPGGRRGRLSVLALHRILPGPDPLYPEAMDAARFAEMCRWVAAMFTVLPLDAAVQRLRQGTLPERALAISFDDGYADNRHVAMPILQAQGLPATVFVTTGFLDGGCMWNDIVVESFRRTPHQRVDLADLVPQLGAEPVDLSRVMLRRATLEATIAAVKYLPPEQRLERVKQLAQHLGVKPPEDLMMSSAEVRELRGGGLQVGAHTISHPILAKLEATEIRHEVKGSKEFLERLLGEPVGLFAYPNGQPGVDYDDAAVGIVREAGFDAAFSCARGAASASTDIFQLPRFTPWDRTALRFGVRMLANTLSSVGPEERAPSRHRTGIS